MAALPTRLAPARHQELRHLSGTPPDPSRESVVQMIIFRPQPALTSVRHWVSSPAAAPVRLLVASRGARGTPNSDVVMPAPRGWSVGCWARLGDRYLPGCDPSHSVAPHEACPCRRSGGSPRRLVCHWERRCCGPRSGRPYSRCQWAPQCGPRTSPSLVRFRFPADQRTCQEGACNAAGSRDPHPDHARHRGRHLDHVPPALTTPTEGRHERPLCSQRGEVQMWCGHPSPVVASSRNSSKRGSTERTFPGIPARRSPAGPAPPQDAARAPGPSPEAGLPLPEEVR
jgi:hypothetical protein